MGIFNDHSRCRDVEAALRGRISDLEEREERLLQRIEEIEDKHRGAQQEWVERYTALLNPAAARTMAVNHRIRQGTTIAPSPTSPVTDDPGSDPGPGPETARGTSADALSKPFVYPDRNRRVRPMPVLTPDQAGFRVGRRIPVRHESSMTAAPATPQGVMDEIAENQSVPTSADVDAAADPAVNDE